MKDIRKRWILGVMLLGMALPVARATGQQIILETAKLHVKYAVTQKDALELKDVSLRDRSWISPLNGPLFPIEPHRDGNGPRYVGPIEWLLPNGDWLFSFKTTEPSQRPGVSTLQQS